MARGRGGGGGGGQAYGGCILARDIALQLPFHIGSVFIPEMAPGLRQRDGASRLRSERQDDDSGYRQW